MLETDGSTCFLLYPACNDAPEEEDLLVSFLECTNERENNDSSDSELTLRGVKSAKSKYTTLKIHIL